MGTANQGDWIKWEGGECPVPIQTGVEYETRNGTHSLGIAGDLRWGRINLGGDIVAYRIVEEATKPASPEDIGPAATSKPVKSDGGSSDYYKISVKTSHGTANVEVNDVIYAMVGGDFDLANILKAARRMYLASKGGGKEGVDIAYDARKIVWFCEDFERRFGNAIQ